MSDLVTGCHRAHPHDEPCGEPSGKTKWVVSKYAPETGERFQLIPCALNEMSESIWLAEYCGNRLTLPRDEYIPCPTPERWEKVPISDVVEIGINGRDLWKGRGSGLCWCGENEHFRIVDGALVLERRVLE